MDGSGEVHPYRIQGQRLLHYLPGSLKRDEVLAQIGSSTDRENSKPTENTVLSFYLYGTWNEGTWAVRRLQGGVPFSGFSTKPRLQTRRKNKDPQPNKRCQPKMDANAKHFETELLARAEEAARRTAQLSPEANVVTATAL